MSIQRSEMNHIYSTICSVYMGRTPVVILGDYEAVKDAFGKSTTTDRPDGLFDILPDSVGKALLLWSLIK